MIPSRPGSSLGERRQSISSNGGGRPSLGAGGRSSIGASGRTSIGGSGRASTGIPSSAIPRPQSRVSNTWLETLWKIIGRSYIIRVKVTRNLHHGYNRSQLYEQRIHSHLMT